MRISNDKRRKRLAHIIASISKCYGFQPYVDRNIRNEIRNVVLKKLGLPKVNIGGQVLRQGIPHILGAEAVLKPKKGAKGELPEDVKKKLLDLLVAPETLETALTWRMPISTIKGKEETVAKMERNRKDLSRVKDNDLRKRVFLVRNLMEIVVPELAKILYEWNLPKDFIIKGISTRKDIEQLLDSIPSALCLFTLIFQRDQQLQRPIETNDINDVWFLTLAIPYSDIVITENMFASLARQAHLDTKCGTVILSSIDQLEEFL